VFINQAFFIVKVRHRGQLVRRSSPRQEVRGLRVLLRQRHRHRNPGIAQSKFVFLGRAPWSSGRALDLQSRDRGPESWPGQSGFSSSLFFLFPLLSLSDGD